MLLSKFFSFAIFKIKIQIFISFLSYFDNIEPVI